jgi:Na+/proline symporter
MAMVKINRNPSGRDLLVFGLGLPVFFGLLGALKWWRSGELQGAYVAWVAGAVVSLVFLAVRPARRYIYLGWMYVTFPIAWTVSHVLLGLVYFVVATPVALLMRLLGRDSMNRRFDRSAKTYWIARQPERDKLRYFRQF